MQESILQIKNLCVEYDSTSFGKKQKIYAVNNLSLDINEGEIVAIAGESGCGKSTLAKAIMQLLPIKSGEIIFLGNSVLKNFDRKYFVKNVQMIFQNPYASLNPKMKIIDLLKEPLELNTSMNKDEILKTVYDIADKVGLDKNSLNLYPHEFSGGQRQRIAIARALILNPKLIIADEPVSALDVSIQAQIINLLKDLRKNFNNTMIFISHDLGVIKYLADRVAVMYLGEVVELGTTNEIFYTPKHPYTKALLNSIPQINGEAKSSKDVVSGDLPSPSDLPCGCKFHTRCPYFMPICREKKPNNVYVSKTHCAQCHLL